MWFLIVVMFFLGHADLEAFKLGTTSKEEKKSNLSPFEANLSGMFSSGRRNSSERKQANPPTASTVSAAPSHVPAKKEKAPASAAITAQSLAAAMLASCTTEDSAAVPKAEAEDEDEDRELSVVECMQKIIDIAPSADELFEKKDLVRTVLKKESKKRGEDVVDRRSFQFLVGVCNGFRQGYPDYRGEEYERKTGAKLPHKSVYESRGYGRSLEFICNGIGSFMG